MEIKRNLELGGAVRNFNFWWNEIIGKNNYVLNMRKEIFNKDNILLMISFSKKEMNDLAFSDFVIDLKKKVKINGNNVKKSDIIKEREFFKLKFKKLWPTIK